MIEAKRVWEALEYVIDPEVGIDIVSLGLVYEVVVEEGVVTIRFTLTTPGCPMEDHIVSAIEAVVRALDGVERVVTLLVWEPAWNPGMIRAGAL
jgi:metal-sulfur cluster biosynthetic enzyme